MKVIPAAPACVHGVFQRIGQDCTEDNRSMEVSFPVETLHIRDNPLSVKRDDNRNNRVQHFISGIGSDDCIVICRHHFMDVFLCFIRMSVLQLSQEYQMVAHIMPQDRRSLAADLYLFNFVLHGLKLHFTKIAVLRYLLFILIFLKVDDEKYQVGNAECKSYEFNNCFISGIK